MANLGSILSKAVNKQVEKVRGAVNESLGSGKTDLGTSNPDDNNIYKLYDYSKVTNDEITIIDSEWVSSRFMTPDENLSAIDSANRYFSTVRWKFFSTQLGGHVSINPRPGYTPYADIRHGQRGYTVPVTIQNETGKFGMGRFYSESIDDNAFTVMMTFGIPRFNSLVSFFTRAVDGIDSYVAKHGRMPTGYAWAEKAGSLLVFVFFPLVTTSILTLKALASLLANDGNNFNYYYMEPAMHMYWASVNQLVTQLSTELGLLVPEFNASNQTSKKIGQVAQFDQEDIDFLKKYLPGLISDNNYIDVFAIASRAQALAAKKLYAEYELYRKDPSSKFDFLGYVYDSNAVKGEYKSAGSNFINATSYYLSFNNFVTKLFKPGNTSNLYTRDWPAAEVAANGSNPALEALLNSEDEAIREGARAAAIDAGAEDSVNGTNVGLYKETDETGLDRYPSTILGTSESEYTGAFLETIDSNMREGGLYTCFTVDYMGSVSESFSNSVSNMSIGEGVKSVAQSVKDIRFNLAGGNILGEMQQEATNAIKSVVAGALNGITFGLSNVITTILGGGYVDIPKKWDDSSMSFPTITYKTRLIAPYGNLYSKLQNIYIPLCMLLAGTLPMAVGKASYSSPFLCSVFCKGVQKIRLGMITSLSIERGVSNLAYDRHKRAMAFDVSWTITDFSNLITAPMNTSAMGRGVFNFTLEDDTNMGNYLATIASRDYFTDKYLGPKILMSLSRKQMNVDQFFNKTSWAMRAGEKLNAMFGALVTDTALNTSHSALGRGNY